MNTVSLCRVGRGALTAAALGSAALVAAGCTVHAYDSQPAVYMQTDNVVTVEGPPVAEDQAPYTYYNNEPVYLVQGQWYFYSGGHWGYFRREPPELVHYRTHPSDLVAAGTRPRSGWHPDPVRHRAGGEVDARAQNYDSVHQVEGHNRAEGPRATGAQTPNGEARNRPEAVHEEGIQRPNAETGHATIHEVGTQGGEHGRENETHPTPHEAGGSSSTSAAHVHEVGSAPAKPPAQQGDAPKSGEHHDHNDHGDHRDR